jgi:hypothetical protein
VDAPGARGSVPANHGQASEVGRMFVGSGMGEILFLDE